MKEKAEAEAREKRLKEDNIQAEVMVVEMIAQLNLSMNTASTFSSTFKCMFPDF